MVSFTDLLKSSGWSEIQESVRYRKNSWEIFYDTSSWIEVGTANNPRIFDVPHPEPRLQQWSVLLIEHLCKMEDERFRLREALALILKADPQIPTVAVAQDALQSCYHRWLVKSQLPESRNTIYCCTICGIERHGDGDA